MSLRWVCGSCGSGTLAVLALCVPTSFFSVGRATRDGHSNDPRGRQNTHHFVFTFSVRRRLEKYADLLINFLAFWDELLTICGAKMEVLRGLGHLQAPSGCRVAFGKQEAANIQEALTFLGVHFCDF